MKRAFSRSTAAWLMLLSGCQTAPIVCPKPPDPPARAPLGASFHDEMQRFLSGSLDEPMSYALPSKGARVGTQPEPSRNEGGRLDQ